MNGKSEEKEQAYYIVHHSVLSPVVLKVLEANELLTSKEAATVQEAVRKVGISRSAFYKYKDRVFPFRQFSQQSIVNMNLLLEHRPGVLSAVLGAIADRHGSILAISQGLPLHSVANASLTVDVTALSCGLAELFAALESVPGVREVKVLGQA
ncbi:MAG: ACT domain-containing protein [Firmicutes bacterium]|nr:ACT domain-containing protein [Bacillota bacterium]